MNTQQLRETAQLAHEIGGIAKYLRGKQAMEKFSAEFTPAVVVMVFEQLEAAERERDELKDKLNSIKSTYCHVDTAKNAFIPGCLDAWGRPVPQYLPYDFSSNPGASATQYCNGWNDSGGYWLKHVGYLQQKLSDAEEELARRDAAASELPSDELSRLREWVKCVEAERDKAISWHSSLLKKHDKLQADIARRDAAAGEVVHLYREHNPCNGMKTDWIEIDSEQLASLKESTDPDTAEFRTLQDAAPPAVAGEPVAVVDIQRGRGDGKKFALCYTSAGLSLPDDVYILYTAAQPALLPPKKDVPPFLTHQSGKAIGWNDCRSEMIARGTQPQKPVFLPAERFCAAEYAGSLLWAETEVWNKAIYECAASLDAAGIPYEVKK